MKDKKKYLSFVSKALPLDFPAKKQYLDEISGSVKAYCIEHPTATFEELCRKFGTAEEIAESIAAESGGEALIAHQKKRKTSRAVIAVTVIAIILLSLTAVLGFYEYTLANSGNFIENIIINQTTDFNLMDEPLGVNGTWAAENVLVTEVQSINATKIIEYQNKKGNLLFRISVTSDFLMPYVPATEALIEIAAQEPKIQVETLDADYSVRISDVVKENNSIRFKLIAEKGSQMQEKEIAFYVDQNGNLN